MYLNLKNTSYTGEGKDTFCVLASRLARNLLTMRFFFFFDKNIEPARDLSLAARDSSVLRTSPLPPAAGRLWEADSLHTTSCIVKMETDDVYETALFIYPLRGCYMTHGGVSGGAFGRGTALQDWRLRARFPMGKFGFFIEFTLPAALCRLSL